ncbi:uncharacterized protein SPSK_02287 [Sporothrix schenckii 1099-18]|uniref:CID domain-containing protein n=2 Tax=Sporothrix schenckii TaxID=29908 RepID=U7PJB2_SPOS1|nr:uncharacterized protein SPSK_02287 [Sporothrix schenckii 1099-18]ERS95627.1 hypothetical protein HMPREF1624_08143 [Sporothrix schenckii ATCC 58251]KJR86646.1 hypothetical protein SPSK_02287 [Sporothrix schenckii 1099-18]
MAATAAQLAIATASLTAVLLRPDPAPCSRADIDEFAGLLALTAARCSPANVQTCKHWMLRHVTHSPARTAAVGRYLVALAHSFPPETRRTTSETEAKPTSARRKRLHLLYVISDVLYHVAFRSTTLDGDNATRPPFVASIEPSLLPLVSSAAAFVRAPKQLAKLNDLLDLWASHNYVGDNVLQQLRTAVDEGPRRAEEALQKQAKDKAAGKHQKGLAAAGATSTGASKEAKETKEAPFLLPALHGDPAVPWYDWPAATWLHVLEPNSTRPMNPANLQPLQLAPGPAPPALEASVRALLADVDRMYEGEGGEGGEDGKDGEMSAAADIDSDVNALGERIDVDVLSGDIVGGDTYYGWSRAFCKSMKERRRRWKTLGGTGFAEPDSPLPPSLPIYVEIQIQIQVQIQVEVEVEVKAPVPIQIKEPMSLSVVERIEFAEETPVSRPIPLLTVAAKGTEEHRRPIFSTGCRPFRSIYSTTTSRRRCHRMEERRILPSPSSRIHLHLHLYHTWACLLAFRLSLHRLFPRQATRDHGLRPYRLTCCQILLGQDLQQHRRCRRRHRRHNNTNIGINNSINNIPGISSNNTTNKDILRMASHLSKTRGLVMDLGVGREGSVVDVV